MSLSSKAKPLLQWASKNAVDWVIFWALCTGYVTWLLGSVWDLGYARDEGFYFQAADSYLSWFKLLFDDPSRAVDQTMVDRYWRINSEHPALVKSLFALSRHFLFDKWHVFAERGTSYRFVGMVFGGLAVSFVYLWGKRAFSRSVGLMAALLFAFIPRVFYHSHLDCFDVPVLSMWVITSYAYWRSLGSDGTGRTIGWAITTGLLYGLLLNTKHNSWLLPFALVAHVVLTQGPRVLRGLKAKRLRVPRALWAMLVLGPPVFYYLWPWIWFDTFKRFAAYVRFHTAHVYYNMEYLGHTYFRPPFPRSYSWLMTLSTVPLITLVLFLCGLLALGLTAYFRYFKPWRARLKSTSFMESLASDEALASPEHQVFSTQIFWLLCILVSYAPWVFNTSPIFGGTKHWMTAYPFMCLFAGVGFQICCRELRKLIKQQWIPIEGFVACAALLGPLTMTANAHPWALSAYTPFVGGASGAATLGLNRSFWGYTTGAVQDQINELTKKRDKVFIHDTAMQSWQMMARDKRVRRDLRPQIGVAYSRLGIYHHEQHMSRVEHQIWVEYGTVKPVHIGHHDGVPVVWLYKRPSRSGR